MQRTDRIKHSTVKDSHYLTVIHSDKIPKEFSQIGLSKWTGEGSQHHDTTTAQINVTVYGQELFNGSWDELREILQQATEGNAQYAYKVGQPVCWSWGKEQDYFIIKRYNAGTDASGDNGNRYQIADKAGNISRNIKESELLPY